VIREIVCGLYDMYGVTKILGIQVKHYFVSCSPASCFFSEVYLKSFWTNHCLFVVYTVSFTSVQLHHPVNYDDAPN
jgi:hypothetical protein